MAWYEVQGYGRDSGRKRKRKFEAKSQEDAIMAASIDGTIVESIVLIDEPMARSSSIRHYYIKIAGVTKGNRQAVIARCEPMESLLLDSEEDNPVDPNAIRILRQNGEQLGYVPAEYAPDIGKKARAGFKFGVYISELTGGEPGKPTRGVNLLVVEVPPQMSQSDGTAYLQTIVDSGELNRRGVTVTHVYTPATEESTPHETSSVKPTARGGCLTAVVLVILLAAAMTRVVQAAV